MTHAKLTTFRNRAWVLTHRAKTKEQHSAAAAAHRKVAACYAHLGNQEAAKAHAHRQSGNDEAAQAHAHRQLNNEEAAEAHAYRARMHHEESE